MRPASTGDSRPSGAPARCAQSAGRFGAPNTVTPGTSAASAALASGRYSSGMRDARAGAHAARGSAPPPACVSCASCAMSPSAPPGCASRARPHAIANAPRIGRSAPVSDSSPANSRPASASTGICPLAARMPSAIGRSKRPDSFGRSAGARLTVMRRTGNSNPQFCSAARTRSRLSRTSRSGRPTIENDGNPLARWTSTVTSGARPAAGARLRTTASDMARLL
ncbi:hypothetical protein FEP79_02786 [Burkholderia multivorans]|nr:hypothetical protein [Burkholderia multivorans]